MGKPSSIESIKKKRMAAYIDLFSLNQNQPVFSLSPLAGKTVLKCNAFHSDLIVKVLTPQESPQPSKRKYSFRSSNEQSVTVQVTIGGQKMRLQVNPVDVVKNWGVPERTVIECCEEGLFETLPLKSPFAFIKRTDTSPIPLKTDFGYSEAEVTQPKFSDLEAPARPIAHVKLLDRFPFLELKQYLYEIESTESELTECELLLQREWDKIVKYIRNHQDKWVQSCEENGDKSLIINDASGLFRLEFFHDDFTTWLHFKCADRSLALNTETGILFRCVKIKPDKVDLFRQIQMLCRRCPHIQPLKLTAIKTDNPYVLVPCFSHPFEEVSLPKEMQDEIVLGWLQGLDALHAAGVVHWGMGPESLLIQFDPKTQKPVPIIGGFSHSFLATKAPHRQRITPTFQNFMPPECRTKDAVQQFVKVPPEPFSVDVYQMGCFLKQIYEATINEARAQRILALLYWFTSMQSDLPLITRPTIQQVCAAWPSIPK